MWNNDKYTFVRYKNGNAFYYITCPLHISGQLITITHLISGQSFSARHIDLEHSSWKLIPDSYKMDACSLNPFIRENCDDFPSIHRKDDIKKTEDSEVPKYDFLPHGKDSFLAEIAFATLRGRIVYVDKQHYEDYKREGSSSLCMYDHITNLDLNPNSDIPTAELVIHHGRISQNLLHTIYQQNSDLAGNYVVEATELAPQESQVTKKPQKMESTMLSTLGLEMGKYEGNELALSMAGIAMKKRDGNYVVYDRNTKTLIEVGDLKMESPFYLMPIAYAAIQEGDLLKIDGQFIIVQAKNADGGLRCIHPTTGTSVTKIARNNMWGMYFYTKVISFMEGFMPTIGGQEGTGLTQGMNPMMMLMMGDKKDGKGGMDSMMEMMLMSQVFGAGRGPFQAFQAPVPATSKVYRKKAVAPKRKG